MDVPASSDIVIKKALGKAHLQSDRLQEAMLVFIDILDANPQELETSMTLGDIYLAYQDGQTALRIFQFAQEHSPQHPDLQKRVSLASSLQRPPLIPEHISPLSAESVEYFLEAIGAPKGISEENIQRAYELINEINSSPEPSKKVAAYLDEINRLLPAMIELNIRQAVREGRTELVEKLEVIKTGLQKQDVPPEEPPVQPVVEISSSTAVDPAETWILCSDLQSTPRAILLQECLARSGRPCRIIDQEQPQGEMPRGLPGAVVAFNPHSSAQMVKKLAACAAAQVPVIVDLDDDFEKLPINHSRYARYGLATQAVNRSFQSSLLMASLVTVPSPQLVEIYQQAGYPVRLVPDGWSKQNALWAPNPDPDNDTISLGWVGGQGQVDDFLVIRRIVMRILHEFRQARLVIQGEARIFNIFDHIPPSQRLFLPEVSYEDHPYTLSQVDILLAPYRDIPYNQSISDRALVEAGIKNISWIATPLPSFVEWGQGGLFAANQEEWHAHIRQLVMDQQLSRSLAQDGRARALEREVEQLARCWQSAFDQLTGIGYPSVQPVQEV